MKPLRLEFETVKIMDAELPLAMADDFLHRHHDEGWRLVESRLMTINGGPYFLIVKMELRVVPSS